MNSNAQTQQSDISDQIRSWFIEKMAMIKQVDKSIIEIDIPFVEYGLDSINSLAIAGELEELMDIELPATLLWDYPTINKVTEFLKNKTF